VDPLIYGDGYMELEEFYKILGLKGTVRILKYLSENRKTKYLDLSSLISYVSLNKRLMQLEKLNLIENHFDRGKEKREEWYEITEKGKKLVTIFEQLEQIIKE
jgi:DNA-binding HxlR family transcriptional regulator